MMTIYCETRHRRSIRLRNYDYASAGAYFITMVTVMPNVHGIIVIAEFLERATSRSPLHSGPTKRSFSDLVGGFKSAVTKRIGELRGQPGTPVWQRNYFEHVIRNEKSLQGIRQYIVDNRALGIRSGESVSDAAGTQKCFG